MVIGKYSKNFNSSRLDLQFQIILFEFLFLGKYFSTERSKKLFELINYRLDMLFVNNRVFITFHLEFYLIFSF
jgi:hypothetical protein